MRIVILRFALAPADKEHTFGHVSRYPTARLWWRPIELIRRVSDSA